MQCALTDAKVRHAGEVKLQACSLISCLCIHRPMENAQNHGYERLNEHLIKCQEVPEMNRFLHWYNFLTIIINRGLSIIIYIFLIILQEI